MGNPPRSGTTEGRRAGAAGLLAEPARRAFGVLRLALLAATVVPCGIAGDLTQSLYPAGGGSFLITLSTCQEKAAILNGRLTNHTGDTWLYIEIQVKVAHGSSSATYRFNLERIGAKGGAMRQRLEGMSKADCETIRLSELELIAAHSDARAAAKKR